MDYLKINHFKCFEDVDICINRLTIMAGANGNGKSTAIQALLYLRHTIEHCGELSNGYYMSIKTKGLNVPLNGVYCLALGNSSFILNQNYGGNVLSIGLFNERDELTLDYNADNRESQLWLTPIDVHKTIEPNFPIIMNEFYYLNAERIGLKCTPKVGQ